MGLAATPVDAELARPNRAGSLLATITPIVDNSDYETPDILSARLDASLPTDAQRDRQVRWVDGYSFYPDDCNGGHIVDPCAVGSADSTDTGQSTAISGIQPFIIEATDTCSTFGNPPEVRIERAKRKLLATRSRVLAKEFWRGDMAQSQSWTNNQYLTKTGFTQPSGGPAAGYITALAELEQAIANGSPWQRGVIHATPYVVSYWISNQLVRAVPNPPGTLMTELGTLVVADAGYDGSSTAGMHSVHLQWAYATGIPQIRLGEIRTIEDDPQVVDRSTNDRTIRAWQFASIAITPCTRAGVLVNLASAISIPGS